MKTIQYLGSEKVVGGWEVSEKLYAFLHVYYMQDNTINVLPFCNAFTTLCYKVHFIDLDVPKVIRI